jgi:hypothetical protein
LPHLLLPSFVILPGGDRGADVALLSLLRAATQQDNERFAVLAEINPVTGPKSSLYSKTPDPTDSTFEKFPSEIRVTAVVTFAAASAFRLSNHSA